MNWRCFCMLLHCTDGVWCTRDGSSIWSMNQKSCYLSRNLLCKYLNKFFNKRRFRSPWTTLRLRLWWVLVGADNYRRKWSTFSFITKKILLSTSSCISVISYLHDYTKTGWFLLLYITEVSPFFYNSKHDFIIKSAHFTKSRVRFLALTWVRKYLHVIHEKCTCI